MSTKLGWFAVIGLTSVFAIACDDNPLSEGRDAIERLNLNPSVAFVKVSDSTKVTAIAVNRNGEPTGAAVTGTACDGKITVAPDANRVEFEPPERFVVKGVTAGESCVNVSAGGKQATVTIHVVN
ncbi:MAG: hypothetical protein L0271_18470 [Gemmatimonadetes bacterium]|nr:hypothetical protein [Gemmatimonadota bacterium]